MRLAVWSPLPPSRSGIADYVSEQLVPLRRALDVVLVSEEPAQRPPVDMDLYHLGNSPEHAFVWRAALAEPGVLVLHDWSLHHLVLSETVERGDLSGYLREMRRAHGEGGTFVGRQVARGLGGDLLPALYPLNDRVLESSLAVVGLTEYVTSRARARTRGRPVLHLPHHVSLPAEIPTKSEARRILGLPEEGYLLTAPGLATVSKRLEEALGSVSRLKGRHPSLRLLVAGERDERLPLEDWARAGGVLDRLSVTGRLDPAAFVLHLAAADVVLALRFPTHGEISGALLRALGVGRAALVTAGTPAAEEFPPGVVVPIDPGRFEAADLDTFIDRLGNDRDLREALGRRARAHVETRHELVTTTGLLVGFLEDVLREKERLMRSLAPARAKEGSLLAYLLDEVRWAERDLGLEGLSLGHEERLFELVGQEE